jgi:polyhydroxyalkanoate synthase
MLTLSPETILNEFAMATDKLFKGYEALKKVSSLDVGTSPKEVVWRKDKIELFRYAASSTAAISTPVLLVYAMVNRHNMMDIQSDKSFIRNLTAAGLDLFLINWSYPSPEDKYITMDNYINGYINDAVDYIRRSTGHQQVTLMGICQGGTFSVIYSALHPEKVKNLVTLVTPINFQTEKDTLSKWARHLNVDALVDHYGNIPGALLNVAFEKLKPMLKTNKYVSILNAVDKEAQLTNFLRMEYWIADSPDQAGACFRQFIKDLYQENKLVRGTLELAGRLVDLKKITMPLLNIYAETDHLVPPDSSVALNNLVGSADKTLTRFAGGHIGVFVGSRSQKELAPGIASWLKKRGDDV